MFTFSVDNILFVFGCKVTANRSRNGIISSVLFVKISLNLHFVNFHKGFGCLLLSFCKEIVTFHYNLLSDTEIRNQRTSPCRCGRGRRYLGRLGLQRKPEDQVGFLCARVANDLSKNRYGERVGHFDLLGGL